MFEKLTEKREIKKIKQDLKKIEYLMCNALECMRIYKADLYEIEHDLLLDWHTEYIVKTFGSIENCKKYYEAKLEETTKIYNKYLNKSVQLEMKIRDIAKS